ncbi:MAG: glycosyltransferase family 2 protein [Parcubacteria group bacterium]|nr:glycosyltransferase family 2 protein [Parcubacteria group bacterium]
MDLSAIILNYNTKDFLLPCIKGMVQHTADLDYEIVIVDNASTDGSVAYIKEKILPRFPQVKLLESKENKGFSAGNNLGISRSAGRYALIMNPDIVIWDNSLKAMADYMDANPNVGIAGPRLLSPDGSLQYFVYRFPSPQVLMYRRTPLARLGFAQRAIKKYLMMDWDHTDNRQVDWVQGSCMIARREAIKQVGLMDERFFLFLEDTDWCRRFWEAGFEVRYLSDVEIIHYHGRASVSSHFYLSFFNKMSWIHLGSALKYFRKWGFNLPEKRHA